MVASSFKTPPHIKPIPNNLNPIQNARTVLSCHSLFYALCKDIADKPCTLSAVDVHHHNDCTDSAYNGAYGIGTTCIACLSFPPPPNLFVVQIPKKQNNCCR
jgi:hypothetical protein